MQCIFISLYNAVANKLLQVFDINRKLIYILICDLRTIYDVIGVTCDPRYKFRNISTSPSSRSVATRVSTSVCSLC